MPIFGSKFENTHCSRISLIFQYVKNSQKSVLKAPRNGQSVTYSKIQTKVCRVYIYEPLFIVTCLNWPIFIGLKCRSAHCSDST